MIENAESNLSAPATTLTAVGNSAQIIPKPAPNVVHKTNANDKSAASRLSANTLPE